MNQDIMNNTEIETWINHINTNNKKRKRECDNTLINELITMTIENLIGIINENKSKNTYRYILSIEKNFKSALLGLQANDNKRKCTTQVHKINNTSDKTNELNLTLIATLSISLDLINNIKQEYKVNKNLNIINFLNNIMKQYTINIDSNYVPFTRNISYTKNSKEVDDFIADDESDDTYEIETDDMYETSDSEFEEEYINKKSSKIDNMVKNFITELKDIGDGNNTSKEEIINHFNNMDKDNKITTLDMLKDINNINKMNSPALFRILSSPLTPETKKNLISKILTVSSAQNENGKMKKWLDDIMKLPFGIYKGIDISKNMKQNKIKKFLNKLDTTMNNAVWGHNEAKKEIVQIIAQQVRNPTCKGSVIGLWGPPGNGKTSLVKQGIADAMDKPFVFMSLGGATDASFLEGHSFTYEGSIYGRIAQALIDCKCMNPVIYFDELDKVSQTPKGEEIINLLIHLIDPVQNQLFRDKYFYDVDIDMSKVTFIFSFNDPNLVNYILKDRITLIETKHLTLEEKLYIGKNYLMREILKDVGIEVDSITIPEDIMIQIIDTYTHEGGVRSLKKHLYSIVRELNVANLTGNLLGNTSITFPLFYNDKLYDLHYNGISPFNQMCVHKVDGVGMVNGLWANSMGVGGILPIETVLIPTNELMGVKATGSLGNVIKESIDVAMSVAWNWLDQNTKTVWMKKWKQKPERFHVHCPDGSTNKEGPSAGAAMSLAFYSRLTNRMIRHNVAMTGEINLRGEVSEIGGLEEKLNAAKKGGATTVLVPYENTIDLIKIKKRCSKLIDLNFKVIPVKTFDEVISHALL